RPLDRPLIVRRAPNGYVSVNGTPTDCVHIAVTGLLEFIPDMIVSGINLGANMGDDTIYSGTVAAAAEGYLLGIPALAVSLTSKAGEHFESAIGIALQIVERFRREPLAEPLLLNINVPDAAPAKRTRARMVERLREAGIRDERVLGAMGSVPRHLFVEEALASRAYEDTALPIGFSQTISQPYVVARMIELVIQEKPLGKVLEVGTGCGYQAAVLAQIFPEVYSIERIKALLERARANLLGLRLKNLRLAHGDGYAGLERAAPFQSIIVAAAARQIPDALLRQLA